MRLLKQKLKEKEKRIESTKINAEERLNIALETRDKEIKLLQEQLAQTFHQQQQEIDSLNKQIHLQSQELLNKDRQIDMLQRDGYSTQNNLQQHVDKLKDVLTQKSDIINNLEESNRQFLDQTNQLKNQISQMEIKMSSIIQQS